MLLAEPFPQIKPLFIGPLLVDPPILQAPMAGYTNYAFRQIVREFGGAGLLATEMVNAKGFVWLAENEAEHPDRLWGVMEEPRPLAVQIWDNDPVTLAKVGARLAHEYKVSGVEINFGCPVRDVVEKVADAFGRYDIDGVMIARASLAKPWLFRQAAAALSGKPVPPDPTLEDERQLLLHHFELICRRFGDAKGTLLMRKYACCYAQGRPGAREFRSRVVKIVTPNEFRGVVEQNFPRDR